MEGKKGRSVGFHLHPSFSNLHLVYLLRCALVVTFTGSATGDQQNPYAQSALRSYPPVTEVQDSVRGNLSVCADVHPVPDVDKVLVLWERLNSSECFIMQEKESGEVVVQKLVQPNGGVLLSDVVSGKPNNLTVLCKSDGIQRSGKLHYRTGENEYSSSECTVADWLKHKGANNLTICLTPPSREEQLTISYNATTPIAECSLIEDQQPPGKQIRTMVHVLPFSVLVQLNDSSVNSSFSVECFYPPYETSFVVGPVVNNRDSQVCGTTFLTVKRASDTPSISPAHQTFLIVHTGLFVVCVLIIVICIAVIAMILKKKLGLHRRRQGQRLLVNEDADDAAFREYREMEE